MKILIVEDEELKRMTLLADLTQAGHAVNAAESAHKALTILEQEQMDVVITDLKLPGMDGLELLRTIKEEIAPATEVIMMTAYGTIPLAVEAIRRGALDCPCWAGSSGKWPVRTPRLTARLPRKCSRSKKQLSVKARRSGI